MNEKVHALINQQINTEFYSAYLYLNFSNYFEEVGLDGFANWYKIQAQEERDHAMLFYQYLQNENQKVTLEAIDKPDLNAACHMDVLKAGLEHEKYVTSLINDIYSEAYEARDFRTKKSLIYLPEMFRIQSREAVRFFRLPAVPRCVQRKGSRRLRLFVRNMELMG